MHVTHENLFPDNGKFINNTKQINKHSIYTLLYIRWWDAPLKDLPINMKKY